MQELKEGMSKVHAKTAFMERLAHRGSLLFIDTGLGDGCGCYSFLRLTLAVTVGDGSIGQLTVTQNEQLYSRCWQSAPLPH